MGHSNGVRMSPSGFPEHGVRPPGALSGPGSPETKGMSGWLRGGCVSYTNRLGGADSLLQSCTTFRAEGNLWALVSATHRLPRREHESDRRDPSGREDCCAVSRSRVSFPVVESRCQSRPQHPRRWALTCCVHTHSPCLPSHAHLGHRWFITQTGRTKSWDLHLPEQ